MLADNAGHPLDLDRLDTDAVIDAMIQSFSGNEEPLRALIHALIG
jgi:cell filamentation protein